LRPRGMPHLVDADIPGLARRPERTGSRLAAMP
jgi:hypothetical protein